MSEKRFTPRTKGSSSACKGSSSASKGSSSASKGSSSASKGSSSASKGFSSASKGSSSASKYRTPSNLNSTTIDRRISVITGRSGSASKPLNFRSQSYLDLTGVSSLSNVCPNIKTSLTNVAVASTDYVLDCDFAYSDYLEAFLKEEILENIIQENEADINDQLILQKDNLYRSKLMCRNIKQELEEIETLNEVQGLLNSLDNNFATFFTLNDNCDLKNNLEQLLRLFNLVCNIVTVKNVRLIEEQNSCDSLKLTLTKCVATCSKMVTLDLNVEAVCYLADLMTKYKEKLLHVDRLQKAICESQNNEMYRLFKFISDVYAEKEKYQ